MGPLLDCFRGSDAERTDRANNGPTPDTNARRQAAADAADRRLQQSERRGVDEDELRRMKQRQADRDRLEQQQANTPKQNNSDGGLRWQMN